MQLNFWWDFLFVLVQDAAAKQEPFISTLFAKLAFKKPAKLYI